jgi:hypothetical protein
MWVFTDKGFVSIVEHREDPETLVVRSRFAGHIRNLFPGAKVIKTPDADYLYRAFLPRQAVKEKLAESVQDIDYPNFKNSIDESPYHEACKDVWSALYRHQRGT